LGVFVFGWRLIFLKIYCKIIENKMTPTAIKDNINKRLLLLFSMNDDDELVEKKVN